jgi:hypothetical protein
MVRGRRSWHRSKFDRHPGVQRTES